MNKLPVYRITKPRGLRGEMRAALINNVDVDTVTDEGGREYAVVAATRGKGGMYFVRLGGVDTIEHAEALRGVTLYCDGDALDTPLAVSHVGYAAVSAAVPAVRYGEVVSVENYGAADVYEVGGGDVVFLFAAAPGVIARADDDARVLYLDLPEGVV